jgi:hypothetical protein
MGDAMNDLKNEVAREYQKIARRWRLRTAAFYGSIIALLLLLAHVTEPRKDEVAGLQQRSNSAMADRRP